MIVLDASGAVAALLNDGHARRLVAAEAFHAPHLIDAEVVSALRRQAGARSLNVDDAHAALNVWRRLALIRYAALHD